MKSRESIKQELFDKEQRTELRGFRSAGDLSRLIFAETPVIRGEVGGTIFLLDLQVSGLKGKKEEGGNAMEPAPTCSEICENCK